MVILSVAVGKSDKVVPKPRVIPGSPGDDSRTLGSLPLETATYAVAINGVGCYTHRPRDAYAPWGGDSPLITGAPECAEPLAELRVQELEELRK